MIYSKAKVGERLYRHAGAVVARQCVRNLSRTIGLLSLGLMCCSPNLSAQDQAQDFECSLRASAEPSAPPTWFFHDKRFENHDTGVGHPERPERVRAIVDNLRDSELWASLHKQSPEPATDAELGLVHSSGYLASLKTAAENAPVQLDADTVLGEGSLEVAQLATGAALDAVDALMAGEAANAFVASRPPGHHAFTDAASGFCIFNHVAVAARYAQAEHGLGRVLIVDWDVHHGNATEKTFYEDGSVMFFSTHQYPHYPHTGLAADTGAGAGEGTNINVPLPAGSGTAEVLGAYRDILVPAANRFKPDLVIISAGFDSHADDPLANFRLTASDFNQMTRIVRQIAEQHAQGRLISVLEGGYNLDNMANAVQTHVEVLSEAWDCAKRMASSAQGDSDRVASSGAGTAGH